MKKFYIVLYIVIASLTQLQAQAPQGFNYQATVRNSSGDLIVNTNVYFKFNIMQGSQTSLPLFTEVHYVPTDDLGQVTLVIGQGTATTGAFSELDWSLGSYYLGIELDTGNGYVAMGTSQLLSVPYALYAENAGGSLVIPSNGIEGQVLSIVDGVPSWVDFDSLSPCGDPSFIQTWYIDADGDGYGFSSGTSCIRPENGYLLNELSDDSNGTDDCDDGDANEFPGQVWYIDADGDGYGGASVISCVRPENGYLLNELSGNGNGTDDCNDFYDLAYPGATEIEDDIDNDCDGDIDGNSIVDVNGNIYDYLTYGNQQWTVSNAEMVTYRDGTPIPQVTDATEWANLTTGAWCYYNNDPTKGKLYNRNAVLGIHDTDPSTPNKELAPEGWHVPTYDEWTALASNVTEPGNSIAKSMASNTGWAGSNDAGDPGNDQSTNNSSLFNAFPVGDRLQTGSFSSQGEVASFWCADDSYSARRYLFYSNHNLLGTLSEWQAKGFSVRFVKD